MFFKNVVDISRKISFSYDILKKYEVGIVLFGWEICSIRLNSFGITGSYVKIKQLDCWLVKSFVKVHGGAVIDCLLETRDRKLLLNSKEINNLKEFLNLKRYTFVPSKVYWKKNFLKLEVCLCIGKKKYDKRAHLKTKEWKLDKMRLLKMDVSKF